MEYVGRFCTGFRDDLDDEMFCTSEFYGASPAMALTVVG
jgi:hypothetical protein